MVSEKLLKSIFTIYEIVLYNVTMQSKRVDDIFEYLAELIPNPRCELDYVTDIDLLVAIILSAQCTDRRVNAVTKVLFEKYRTINDYADACHLEFEKDIYSTGFYRNKAKNIIALCKKLRDDFGSVIPGDVDVLEKLPGIGRKTASVFVAEFHKKPAIAVDTHVIRVSRRLGFTTSRNPDVIQRDLMKLFDEGNWCLYHKYLVLFGRYYCTARGPKCDECGVSEYCVEFRG